MKSKRVKKVSKKHASKKVSKKVINHRDGKSKAGKAKIEKVMHEAKAGKLHSGSKKGPVVTNPKQMIAIALSEAKKTSKKHK